LSSVEATTRSAAGAEDAARSTTIARRETTLRTD
jgi:hypothetical protein